MAAWAAILPTTLCVSLLLAVGSAQAANRIFNLHLKNIDSQPITFKILTTGHNCYQGSPGLGQIFENVAPGKHVTIRLARVQGHGCNGEQGQFEVEFTPGVGTNYTIQHFDFDNSGTLNRTSQVNSYPGSLSAKAADESYTYFTHQRPVVTASKAVGSWEFLCQGVCNDTVSKEITNTTTNEKTQSRETTQAISIALQAGVNFPGGSAQTTVTASQEKKVGQSMSQSISRGETNTKGKTILFSPEQMRDLGIFAVWQWVASTRMSTGSQIIVTTDKISCTADGNPPTYLPGAIEDIEACRGGLAKARNQAQDQQAAQNLVMQQQAAQQLANQQATQQLANRQAAQQTAQLKAAQNAAAQQLAAIQQATADLAAQQKATQLAAAQLAAQQQQSAAPRPAPAPARSRDVAPAGSPVSIVLPAGWISKPANGFFDVELGDTGDNFSLAFKFMNTNGSKPVIEQLIAELKSTFPGMTEAGPASAVAFGGMQGETQIYQNAMGSGDTAGKPVDVAIGAVQAPNNRLVVFVAAGLSNTPQAKKDQLVQIMQNLRVR
jgi:hypothetical protein